MANRPQDQSLDPATVSFVHANHPTCGDLDRKLMFRIKLQIDPSLLGEYHNQVKTGLRAMGFVRTDSAKPWSNDLAVKLPQ